MPEPVFLTNAANRFIAMGVMGYNQQLLPGTPAVEIIPIESLEGAVPGDPGEEQVARHGG